MDMSTKGKILGVTAIGAVAASKGVSAAAILANDTFEGLGALGSNLGAFFTNITPGVVALVFTLSLISAVIYLLWALASRIKGGVNNDGRRMR